MEKPVLKKTIAEVLMKCGILKGTETGKIIINLNQGGVTSIEKTESIA